MWTHGEAGSKNDQWFFHIEVQMFAAIFGKRYPMVTMVIEQIAIWNIKNGDLQLDCLPYVQ